MSDLRAVARRILGAWSEGAGWVSEPEEVDEALQRILRNVDRMRSGGGADPVESPPNRPLLDHRLCSVLRVELLRTWSAANADGGPGRPEDADSPSAEALLATLAALESYRETLRPEGSEELAARLQEPDAFELIIELAHDLRSPLNSILFLSEVLRSGQSGHVTPHQWKQLGLIYSATLGMVSVVNDLMDLATEEHGSPDEDMEPFSIGGLFDSVGKLVRPMAEEKGISLDFQLPDYDRCQGRPAPLTRVLLNLTTNAIKFTDEGWVTVSAEKVGRALVEFSVTDSGRGIAPEEMERLFQPFRKSSGRSGYFFSGSGLGLSIVRRLLTRLDSELRVESEPDGGSRFSFQVELPAI